MAKDALKLAFIIMIIGAGSTYAGPDDSMPQGPKISRIVFFDNRADEHVLRPRLPFSEGDFLSPTGLNTARESLLSMHQFKKVTVSSSAAADDSAEISIRVKDGWYSIPLPFFAAGSGGSLCGSVLVAR